jgi:diguanylate cyclase (GGDEF)-like protein
MLQTASDKTKTKYAQLNSDYNSLLKEEQGLRLENDSLSERCESVVELYEITKYVTRSLEEGAVFEIFKEKLSQYLKIEDLQLVKGNIDYNLYRDSIVIPFDIGIKQEYFLAAKGVLPADQEKYHILAQQFLLGLRRAAYYSKIQDLAIHDTLTGVLTRRYFMERLDEEIKRSDKFKLQFSFLMIDIDHFKDCNDRYGHLVGDVILKEVAQVIKDNSRQVDIVGRYGGEEFSIILTETPKEGALNASERILKNVEDKKIKAYDEMLNLTISIGVAAFPDDGKTKQELIDKADWSLYRAKQTGRNRICIYGVYK